MSGTARFHDKLHRANHHTLSTYGLPDSSYDPIASQDRPFQGSFFLNGNLSASQGGIFSTLNVSNNATFLGSTTLQTATFNESVNLNKQLVVAGTGDNIFAGNLIIGKNITLAGSESVFSTPRLNASSASFTSLTALTARVNDRLGVGITPQQSLHVFGNVLVEGNLSASGSSNFSNTEFSTTSALSIVNTGTGIAVAIKQQGNFGILGLYDDNDVAFWVDGSVDRPGYVGIKTNTPEKELTVNGEISAKGIIIDGPATLNSTLNVATQLATFSNGITVYKDANFYNGTLTVSDGLARLLSGARIENGLTAVGGITTIGGITASGGMSVGANIQLDDALCTLPKVNVGTNIQLDDDLCTLPRVTLNDVVEAKNNVTISNGNLYVSGGSITAHNDIDVYGKILSGGVDLLEIFTGGGGGGEGGGGGGSVVDGELSVGFITLTGATVQSFPYSQRTASGNFLKIKINETYRYIRLWD